MTSYEPVHPDLIQIALSKVSGHRFEDFTQAFWSGLIGQDYVPLGGMHDGGADGFEATGLFSENSAPRSYLQASIEADTKSKIRRTVKRIREYGRGLSDLTYITSRVVSAIDIVEHELSRELDVTVRIRDANFIIVHVNDNNATRSAYTHHLSAEVQYLRGVGKASTIVKSPHVSDPSVYVFLEQELARRDGNLTLIDSVTDSLILWALEGTDPDANLFMSRDDIMQKINHTLPAAYRVIRPRLSDRLRSLSDKRHKGGRQIRWHKRDDLFVLPFETRERIADENRADEAIIAGVIASFRNRVETLEASNLDSDDSDAVCEVALRAIQRTFEQEGLSFVSFLEDEERTSYPTVTDCIQAELADQGISGARGLDIGEAVFQIVRRVFYGSTPVEREYLGKLSRTYTLLFTLNTEPRILEYFQEMTGELNLYVGSDILIKALSERYVPEADQMMRRTLELARALGARLILTDPVIEEVTGNLRSADNEFRKDYQTIEDHIDFYFAHNVDKIMIRAYLYVRLDGRSGKVARPPAHWDAYISQFCDPARLRNGQSGEEIRMYLQNSFSLEHEPYRDTSSFVEPGQLDELTEALAADKSSQALARNDALLALNVYAQRAARKETSSASVFGFQTWWLTGESRILRHTREVVRHHNGQKYMMRPDFLLNFLTLAPGAAEVRRTLGEVFPSLLGIQLSRRMEETQFRAVVASVHEAEGLEEARLASAIAIASNKLKGALSKQYRVRYDGNHKPIVYRSESALFGSPSS